MKKILIIVTIVFALSGCSKINSARIISGAGKALDVAQLICDTAPLFSDNLAKPLAKCQTVLQTAAELRQDERVSALVSTAVCAEEYAETKSKADLVSCIDDIDGAKLLVVEIEK